MDPEGLEPSTQGLWVLCSAIELRVLLPNCQRSLLYFANPTVLARYEMETPRVELGPSALQADAKSTSAKPPKKKHDWGSNSDQLAYATMDSWLTQQVIHLPATIFLKLLPGIEPSSRHYECRTSPFMLKKQKAQYKIRTCVSFVPRMCPAIRRIGQISPEGVEPPT